MNRLKILIICCLTITLASFAQKAFAQSGNNENLKVANLFSDHMVLQQQDMVPIWGKSAPNQKITIIPSWGKPVISTTDAIGNWKTKIATPKAGGPYTLTVKNAEQSIAIKDVLIGEVWLASGQSNMDIGLRGWPPGDTILNSELEISKANYPKIRVIKVPFGMSATPVDSVKGKWIATSPETAGDFSATAYFYARKLYQELNVPIGIIQSAIGGTPAEAWTSKNYLTKVGDFNKTIDGLESLQSTTDNWFKKWSTQTIPKTTDQWKAINFTDLAAAEANYDDSNWGSIQLPGRIDVLNSIEFDGALWLRMEITLADFSEDFVLKIGSVDDMDATYFNGKYVGGLVGGGFATTQREITIPKAFLVKGKNTISIRVIDNGGQGHVRGPITLSNGKGETINLQSDWKSRLVAEMQNGKFYTYGLQANLTERPNLSLLNSNSPTVLFNAMINPLIPYKIKGVIWYQGESNVGRAEQYKRLFPTMIEDWRNKWGYELPFYYVQLAPYLYSAPHQKEQSQKLRDAQSYALKLPRTGMVSTLDIGSLQTVHPPYKQQVGDRLARFALANEYGKKLMASGPIYKNVVVSGSELVIEFNGVGSGLTALDKTLTNFEIAGADKNYVSAQAKIIDNKVVVNASSIVSPVYVRYAWSDGSAATLFNKEGLPAATFTSDK